MRLTKIASKGLTGGKCIPLQPNYDMHLSQNSPSFQCSVAITNFLLSYMCEIRFHDIIGQSTVHGRPTLPNEHVLHPYFSIEFTGFSYVINRI